MIFFYDDKKKYYSYHLERNLWPTLYNTLMYFHNGTPEFQSESQIDSIHDVNHSTSLVFAAPTWYCRAHQGFA